NKPILDPNTGKYTFLHVTNSYIATLPEIIAGLGVRFTPIEKFPIYIRGGLTGNISLSSSSTYTQKEHITSPLGVTYPSNGTTTQIDGSGQIANLAKTFGAIGGLGYPVPLSERLTAAPEVEYYYPFTAVRKDYNWKTQTLQGGLT